MRKYAGILIATLLLVAPALANAFTLSVKVIGGSAANKATVTVENLPVAAATTKVTGGTQFFYPVADKSVTPELPAKATMVITAGGVVTDATTTQAITADGGVGTTYTFLAARNVKVVYAPVATVGFNILQAAGGTIRAELPNQTTTTGNPTGLVPGSHLNILVQANAGYTFTDPTATAGAITKSLTVVGQYDYVVTSGATVTATFTQTPDTSSTNLFSANLLAPLAGFTGTDVKCSANSTYPGATYVFTVTGGSVDATKTVTALNGYYSFTPTAPGEYTVHLNVNNLGIKTALDKVVVVTLQAAYNVSQCTSCHSTSTPAVTASYNTSGHKAAAVTCQVCHTDSTPHSAGINALNISKSTFKVLSTVVRGQAAFNGIAKGGIYCTKCHTAPLGNGRHVAADTNCSGCHTPSADGKTGTGDFHSISGCVGCHAVAQNSGLTFVQDNNGVRAITSEFAKWSHHVTGVALQDQHCAVCHLEGKLSTDAKGVVVDITKHRADASIHLRDVSNDSNEFIWTPEQPNFTTMDNFCMACHSATGATSSKVAAIMATATPASGKTFSATNPFADTISNQYDLEERPAVVDAAGQFATGNNSHHAVIGKKYAGRSRVSKGGTIADAAFTTNSSATMPGKRSTIFDASKFTATYVTLSNDGGETGTPGTLNGRNGGTSLGDDSTLHCGDCHTVGQFRAADVSLAAGSFNKAVIGAHGSANEYMLRNNAGTDARHTSNYGSTGFVAQDGTKPYLVCYNCHAIEAYGQAVNHAGEHDTNAAGRASDCNGPANTLTAGVLGEARLLSQGNGATGIPKAGTEYGNMFGIQCAACHNSGVKGNLFGGIHGSKVQTYEDGMGNTTKHRRFMPGLNNVMYVPGTKGGVTGGTPFTYTNYSSNWMTGNDVQYTAVAVNNTPYVMTAANAAKAAARAAYNGQPSYSFQTGGVSNDLNWEQWKAQSVAGLTDPVASAMGCYTVAPNPTAPVAGAAAAWLAAVPGGSNYQSVSTTTAGSRAAIAKPTGQVGQPTLAQLAVDGYPANDVRYSATYEITAGTGTEVFEVWGGCDDHNGNKGKGTSPTRNVLRPVSY